MKHKKLTAIVLALAMLFGLMPAKVLDNTVYAAGGITLTPIKANPSQQEAEQIVKTLFPDNSPILNKVSNIKINYTGNVNNQISTFSNAKDGGVLTFNEGIALSTGNLKKDLNASNTAKGITGSYNSSVSNESINGDRLYDPCSIEFDINMDVEGSMVLQYAFGSDEYTEYSTGNFNDKFGVIVNNDVNYAVVPGSNPPEYIAINTINQVKNTEFFIDNTDKHLPIELDGITKTFSNGAKLKKGNNHVKIIIGDKGDSTYDSVLFIKAKSFQLKENKPGVLSLAKNGNNLVIKRTNGTDGTVAFTLVEYDLNGLETKLAYSLNDGESEITIPISQNASEDAPNKIAFNTAKVHIKDAKMGATIDTAKDKLTLKIAAPVLTITGTNNDQISIKGLPGATVVVTKEDGTIQNVTLDGSGNGVLTSPQAAGTYTATQTKDTFTSANSNKVIIKKPPIITSTVPKAFDEVIVEQNKTAVAKPYDVTALNVSAQTSNGNPINSPHFTVEIPNEIKNDTKIPGIYTIKWTATDSGFTAVKTKVVKVKPAMPELFYDDYKHSVIFVEGESNAVVHIKDNNNNIVDTIHLDASGEGKLVNPPNGNYGASQIVNGVESEEVRTLTINRTYKHPEITLKDQTIIEGEFTLDANTYSYTEPGAKVSDEEDNKRPVDLSDPHGAKEWDAVNEVNTFLTPKVEIDNPMFSKDGKNQKITITPPALDKQGDPTNSNNSPFQPFVGKYEIKYNVKDTDDLAATPVIRLVRVRPYKPEVSVDTTNEDSSIKIDALSTASIFLYKEIDGEYQPVNIVGGEAELVTDPDNYLDPSRTKLKMPELTNLYDHIEKKMTGLPDGDYKVVQRLYGLSSDLSDKITVLHDVYSPLVKLNGNAVVNIVKDSNYVDDGATVTIGTDPTIDFDETNPNHILDNKVEADKVGIYKVKYEVKHSAGGTSKKGSAERTVVVKPPMPQYEIGDYADFNGDGHKTFKKNSNGNDLKVTGILDGASVQLVKGKDGNGALYKQEFNVNGGEHVFENLVQTEGSTSATDNADDYGIFQTVSEIQSAKNSPFEISKTNTKPKLSFDDEEAVQVIKGESKSISKDEASATDEEDDDDKLTERIRIYTEYEEKDGVIKPKGTAKENISIDTNTVGVKEFYYAVTDTDGILDRTNISVDSSAGKLSYSLSGTGVENQSAIIEVNISMDNYEDSTELIEISLKAKDVPSISINDINKTYDGNILTNADLTGSASFNGISVAGSFEFDSVVDLNTMVNAGTYTAVGVVFKPLDTVNFEEVSGTVNVQINQKANSSGHKKKKKKKNKVVVEPEKEPAGEKPKELEPENKEENQIEDSLEEPKENEEKTNEVEKENNKFIDVNKKDWFETDVEYVVRKKMMKGMSETEFMPQYNVTRAMVVTVLRRASEDQDVSLEKAFTDNSEESWYKDSVNWAKEKGVSKGYTDGTFRPYRAITREELAILLYNYHDLEGEVKEPEKDHLLKFEDKDEISKGAEGALNWAVARGIVSGLDTGLLEPQGNATRAQMATMLRRYDDLH